MFVDVYRFERRFPQTGKKQKSFPFFSGRYSPHVFSTENNKSGRAAAPISRPFENSRSYVIYDYFPQRVPSPVGILNKNQGGKIYA